MKKVLVVDDEEASRRLIREYLEAYDELVVLGEANNGVDAVKLINKYRPNLIFLDVQMPGLTGFEVLTHLEEIPQVIFSTAYDKYALKAFEVHALDYLLKPYTRERFDRAIQRLQSAKQDNPLGPLTDDLLMAQPNYPDRFLVEYDRKLITIATEEIIRIEAYGDYTKLITAKRTYVSNHGIGALEEKLDPGKFMRIHRSHLINLARVASMHKHAKSYDVKLDNDDVVRVSRSYMDRVKDISI